MRVFDFNFAIVRTPGESVVDGQRENVGLVPLHSGIVAEHEAYVEALRTAGLDVETLPSLERFPDSVFVEDPALVFFDAAIVLRPGAPSRAGEVEALEQALRTRFTTVMSLDAGTVDGGDVLVTPDRIIIGLSNRTDRTGAEALAMLLDRIGRVATIVQTPKNVLHLKSGSSLIDEETVLVTPALAASDIFADFRTLVVPADEEAGANALRVRDFLLAGIHYPRTLAMLDAHGAKLKPLSIAEIGKLDAGLTCMSLRW